MKYSYSDNTTIVDYGTMPCGSDESLIIPFNTIKGQDCFNNSAYKNLFFKLAPHYAPQRSITTCGIASAVMVLNTIFVTHQKKRPLSIDGSWYIEEDGILYASHVWDEDNFFNNDIKDIIDMAVIKGHKKISGNYTPGLNLSELALALKAHEVEVTGHHIDNLELANINKFRDLIKQITSNIEFYMIVNYELSLLSSKLNQGHFSPVAAYDANTDRILLLDPWSSFTPWIWVKLVDLYESMHTLDSKNYRGYLLINSKY